MLYYKYSDALRGKYGQKVYKLSVNLALSCPVRDGTKGLGGCLFCGGLSAGYETLSENMSITEQLKTNAEYISRKYGASKFEIYFQNFTNTYECPSLFSSYINEAAEAMDNAVLLSVSTRPDCLTESHLDILGRASEKYGIDITVELGLQSVNDATLRILKRGHSLAHYLSAVRVIQSYGFNVCTHMITTLPWDSLDDITRAADILSALEIDSVKLHTLYVEEGTALADMYRAGTLTLLTLEDFINRTVAFLERLSPKVAVQRLSARVPENLSLFCNWSRSHWVLRDMVEEEMKKRGVYQGKYSDFKYDSGMTKFIGRGE